jgi:hypothetical protein
MWYVTFAPLGLACGYFDMRLLAARYGKLSIFDRSRPSFFNLVAALSTTMAGTPTPIHVHLQTPQELPHNNKTPRPTLSSLLRELCSLYTAPGSGFVCQTVCSPPLCLS